MPTHIALLRGINLGGRNKVAMADLRGVVNALGHTDVSTYIQSGNVLFTPAAGEDGAGEDGAGAGTSALADAMTRAIAAALGVTAPVVVLSRDELAQVVRDNPYPHEQNPRCLHAVFRAAPAGQDLLDKITAAAQAASKGSRDCVTSVGRTLYLHTPDGYGTSDLAQALLKLVSSPKGNGGAGTARNWATVTRLLALCDA